MNKKRLIQIGVAALVLLLLFFVFRKEEEDVVTLDAIVQRGEIVVSITTTGELLASRSEEIQAPGRAMREVGVWQANIADLIPEGTHVDSGTYVAALDRGEIGSKLKDNELEIQKAKAAFTQTKLDTALNMREARNNLTNLQFALEEAKIALNQSEFEPPATIRQNKIAVEKAELQYEQAVKNNQVKALQFAAKMEEAQATLDQALIKRDKILEVMEQFIITAPRPGILIYAKTWKGDKKVVGSRISAWDPTVALLPDLVNMISQTYVNEVDISKIKKGQTVEIELDGAPDVKLIGKVDYIATVGEQLPNSEAKVYEVKVNIDESVGSLLPGMSTSNKIITARHENVLYIPIETVFTDRDVSYVYKKSGFGIQKQGVVTGATNINHVVIKQGLQEGDVVLFTAPENPEKYELIMPEQ